MADFSCYYYFVLHKAIPKNKIYAYSRSEPRKTVASRIICFLGSPNSRQYELQHQERELIRIPRRTFCALPLLSLENLILRLQMQKWEGVLLGFCMLIFAGLLLASSGSPSYAQTAAPNVAMQITPAFEGHFKNGEWLAIWVEVENQGADLDIEIQIDVESQIGATTYAAPLSLPTNSRKRTPVYVRPNSYTRSLTVQLISTAAGPALDQILLEEKVTVEGVINQQLLVGLLSAERGPLSMIQEFELFDNRRELSLVDINAPDLPAKPEALRSLDILIINDVDTSTLSAEQGMALESWIRAGGHLILGGGGSAQRTINGLPKALQPQFNGQPTEIDQADALVGFAANGLQTGEMVDEIKVTGPFVAQWATFPEGDLLAGESESPFVVQMDLGLGTVQYAALSLTDAPFNAWAGNTEFLGALLKQQGVRPEWLPPDVSMQQMRSFQLASALQQLPSLALPSIRWLGILLGIYILLVGPVNYLLLRQFRRLHWAWLTIPLLTIAFAAGSFGLGYALRGTDLILNHIAIVEPTADGTSQVDNYIGLFSPAEHSYDIEIDNNSLISPMSQDSDPFMSGPMGVPVGATGDMTIVNGTTSQIRGFTVNQWAMQSFTTESRWDDFGTIAGELQFADESVIGEVRNATNQPLQDVVVIVGRQFKRLGDMTVGESSSLKIDLIQEFQNGSGADIWWDIYGNTGPGFPERQNELKRQITQGVFQNNFGPPSQFTTADQGILVLGWIDETPMTIQISGREPEKEMTGFVHTKLPLIWPESGSLTIPSNFIGTTLTKYPTNGGQCDRPNTLHMQSGSAELQFELPNGQMFAQIDKLALQAEYDYDMGQDLPARVEFYDWSTQEWQDHGAPETITIASDQANPLVNSNGQIRIRVTATRSFNSCGRFDLSITGEL